MTRRTRRGFGVSGLLAVVAALAVSAGTVGATPAGRADGGTVYFAITHQVGKNQHAAGQTSDKLLGAGAITFVINALPSSKPGTLELNVKQVRVFLSNGTLAGSATAKLTIAATHSGLASVTNGKLTAANGTGAQAGHSFTATFTGIGNVNNSRYKITYASVYK